MMKRKGKFMHIELIILNFEISHLQYIHQSCIPNCKDDHIGISRVSSWGTKEYYHISEFIYEDNV